MPIAIGQQRHQRGRRLGRIVDRSLIGLDLVPQRPHVGKPLVPGVDRRRRFAADVGHAIQLRLRAASAGREVQRLVAPDRGVGQRQRGAGQKSFPRAGVTGSLGRNVHGINRSVRPIQAEQRPLIFGWELCSVAELDADRRALAHINNGRQAIDPVGRPVAGAVAPAEFAAAGGVAHPSGPIPGQAHVGLHVGIVGEDFAVGVQRHVVGIAKADGQQFPLLAVGIGGGDPSAGGHHADAEAAGIPLAGEQQVFVPIRHDPAAAAGSHVGVPLAGAGTAQPLRRIGVDVDRQGREVAGDQIQPLAVGRDPRGVWAVVAGPLKIGQFPYVVDLVVAVGVAQPIQRAAAVVRHIQAVESEQQPLGRGNVDFQSFDPRRLARSDRRRRDAEQPLSGFRRGDHAPLGIDRHRHPRAHLLLGHAEQPLDLKAGEQAKGLAWRLRILVGIAAGHHARGDLGPLDEDLVLRPRGGVTNAKCGHTNPKRKRGTQDEDPSRVPTPPLGWRRVSAPSRKPWWRNPARAVGRSYHWSILPSFAARY